ncbi:putative membrane protein [Sporosarcina psychrophila]|uniref:Membrane protein n=1 Tax=Sporosarcina psychrophila TaxID=1476 RepID=A0ABV2K493_SPOPS|nr:hypothetical protein AZE41_16725 [Sporosarcina psychrophila]
MKTRKGRLITWGIYFLLFTILCVYYFSNKFYTFNTPEQNVKMIKLMIYVFLIFIITLFGEWFRAFEKDSPKYKKYFFQSLAVIWVLLLLIFFKDMFFVFFN